MTDETEASEDAPTIAYLEREVERLKDKVHEIQDAVGLLLRILKYPSMVYAPLDKNDHESAIERHFGKMIGRSIKDFDHVFKEYLEEDYSDD
jgi:UTP:GlnB (protein PII) uridylyltransferase